MSRPQTPEQREQLQALVGGGTIPPRAVPAVAAAAEPEPIPVGEAREISMDEWRDEAALYFHSYTVRGGL